FFLFTNPAPPEIYTLSLHDALPISHKYYETLSSLDWKFLLRSERGLSFWFDLLDRIRNQFQPDVLVIDSRTGFTEIGGLCTQMRSEEHTSELQSRFDLVCRLLLEKK